MHCKRRKLPLRLIAAAILMVVSQLHVSNAGAQIGAESGSRRNARQPKDEAQLRRWLENMVAYHKFSHEEVSQATGLAVEEVDPALKRFGISQDPPRERQADEPLVVLPYPGGRHPRIGFLDGAVNPQRETKVSVFTPWDPGSYAVLDIPEAIWSNLGLTYLAHTHVDTIWTREGIELDPLEWTRGGDGSLRMERTLPNGIAFGTLVLPQVDHVRLEMWLTNGSDEPLSDLRVQNCVMLKGVKGFAQQTNDNKVFSGPYAACRSEDGKRWIISAWTPSHRAWGNAPCPCLHSDPKFPDCRAGETQRLRGWFSFYEGSDVEQELARIDRTGWREAPFVHERGKTADVTGKILDASTGQLVAGRLHVRSSDGTWHFAETTAPDGSAVQYRRLRPNMPRSVEMHTTLSPHPFRLELPPGEYELRVERGKEYVPLVRRITLADDPQRVELPLTRWINMAERGWYSGDTHVHRPLKELPNVMLAEDLNVALPLSYWVRTSGRSPVLEEPDVEAVGEGLISVDSTHVIYPMNTEYEIFSVGDRQHTLGAVFVLNHQEPLKPPAPPVAPIAAAARSQGALLDLDKHSWPWSLMLVPVMDVDLFELSNNHLWQTEFGFKQWTLPTLPDYMHIEQDEDGFTERGWAEFGFQSYYALLNCGFNLRVTAGTASGVHPVQLGFGRVYVHLPDGFTYQRWIEGLDAGRSFVTTGPMLEVKFNGRHPGATLPADDSGDAYTVEISGMATSRRPIDRVEVVVNGNVVETIAPANREVGGAALVSPIAASVNVSRSSWLAVRCFETHPDDRLRFAHTNPVHVTMPGRPLLPRREQVSYLIERMEEELARNEGVLDSASLAEYRAALTRYREIAETAE